MLFAPVIAWVIFAKGGSVVWSVGAAVLFTRTICSLGRVWWVRRLMQVPVSRWFWTVPVRCSVAVAVPLILAMSIRQSFLPSTGRMFVSFLVCGASLCVSGWFFGLDRSERGYLLNALKTGMRVMRQAFA